MGIHEYDKLILLAEPRLRRFSFDKADFFIVFHDAIQKILKYKPDVIGGVVEHTTNKEAQKSSSAIAYFYTCLKNAAIDYINTKKSAPKEEVYFTDIEDATDGPVLDFEDPSPPGGMDMDLYLATEYYPKLLSEVDSMFDKKNKALVLYLLNIKAVPVKKREEYMWQEKLDSIWFFTENIKKELMGINHNTHRAYVVDIEKDSKEDFDKVTSIFRLSSFRIAFGKLQLPDDSADEIGEMSLIYYKQAIANKNIAQGYITSIIDEANEANIRFKFILKALLNFLISKSFLTVALKESKRFSFKIHYNLAHINRQLGRYDIATTHIRDAITGLGKIKSSSKEIITQKASAYSFMAVMMFFKNDIPEALRLINISLSHQETFEEQQDSFLYKMIFLESNGQTDEAQRIFERDLHSFLLFYKETLSSQIECMRLEVEDADDFTIQVAKRRFFGNYSSVWMYCDYLKRFYQYDWFDNKATDYFSNERFLK